MGLKFEHAFVVKAPPERVWAYLTDPYRVATALPGAAVTEKNADGSYAGTMTVKVGPVSARYKGTLRFDKLDADTRTAEIAAKGQESTGRGGADMRMQSRLTEKTPGETEVAIGSEVNVTGLLAQMGRGLIQDVSNQMFQRFTEAVRGALEKPEGAGGDGDGGAGVGESATTDKHTTTSATTSTTTTTSTSASTSTSMAGGAAAVQGAPPIEVLSFGSKLLGRAAGRMMRKPSFWVVVAVVVGLVYWLSR